MFLFAPSSSDTLLSYGISTEPSPLQVSPKQGNPMLAAIDVVVSNNSMKPIYCNKIVFSFSVGKLSQDLTTDVTNVAVAATPGSEWQIANNGDGSFTATPTKPQFNEITTDGILFQLYSIPVNQQIGTFSFSIQETSSNDNQQFSQRSQSVPIAKFPPGFYVDSFAPSLPAIDDGKTVTLSWRGSGMAKYLLSYGQSSVDVTNQRVWTSPPLTNTTTFLLTASVQIKGETLSTSLLATVIVTNPEISATSLTVSGASNLNGASYLGGPVTIGAAAANSLLTINLPLAAHAGASFAKPVTVTADINCSGQLTGQSRIGGGAGEIKGYDTLGQECHFAFKFDSKNFGNTNKAIQIWNATQAVYKTFIIDHPLRREHYLVHATLEGPEGAVYYRGSGRLRNGRAVIQLPDYFEALTHTRGRTILLTNIDGGDPIWVETQRGQRIYEGRFVVVSSVSNSSQHFDWEVKAVRKDQERLDVEPAKEKLRVASFGPYTFGMPED